MPSSVRAERVQNISIITTVKAILGKALQGWCISMVKLILQFGAEIIQRRMQLRKQISPPAVCKRIWQRRWLVKPQLEMFDVERSSVW